MAVGDDNSIEKMVREKADNWHFGEGGESVRTKGTKTMILTGNWVAFDFRRWKAALKRTHSRRSRNHAAGFGREVFVTGVDVMSRLSRLQAGAPNPARLR